MIVSKHIAKAIVSKHIAKATEFFFSCIQFVIKFVVETGCIFKKTLTQDMKGIMKNLKLIVKSGEQKLMSVMSVKIEE